MSLKNKLIGNGVAVAIQKVVRVIEQLVLVPFFISAWGAGYYGEWLTLTIVPSVIALSDLGFGSAAASAFVLKYSSGNKQDAANIAKSGFTVISVLVASSMVLSVIVMVLLNYYNAFANSLIKKEDAIWAVLILILAKLITFYTQMFEAYYRAARKANLSINLMTLSALLNIGGGLIVLLAGWGVVSFSIIQLIISLSFNLAYGIFAVRTLALPKEISGIVLFSEIKMIGKKGFGYLMSPIWQSVYFQGTTFVIRIALGAESVAIFNTVRTATRSINQLFNMIDAATFPEMQFEIGAGNFDKVKKLYRLSMWASFILAMIGFLFLFFFGLWFYNTWTKHTLNVPDAMWNIFIVGILLNALWWTGGVVFRAYNKPFQFTFAGAISAVISVFFTYILSLKFSLIGAALGSVILDILMAIYVLPASCAILGISVGSLVKDGFADILNLKEVIKRRIS